LVAGLSFWASKFTCLGGQQCHFAEGGIMRRRAFQMFIVGGHLFAPCAQRPATTSPKGTREFIDFYQRD
jgi:hypothetical protein